MNMTRRGFMKALGALTALAGLNKIVPIVPAAEEHWADKFARTGVLEDVTLYLDSTLHLGKAFDGTGAAIRNCKFITNPGFQGKYMLDLGKAEGWTLHNCIMDNTWSDSPLQAAIHLNPQGA